MELISDSELEAIRKADEKKDKDEIACLKHLIRKEELGINSYNATTLQEQIESFYDPDELYNPCSNSEKIAMLFFECAVAEGLLSDEGEEIATYWRTLGLSEEKIIEYGEILGLTIE
ncbi:hypothetical protein KAW48_03225 [candidate division WOR-3 bacterium]|nr:hypothetical protein [candidate division WOR-3 bacterium]